MEEDNAMKKKNEIKIRLSDEELTALNKKVKLSGLSREEFARRCFANKKIVELPPVDYGKLIFETRRVGQNLNRLLRIAYANNYFNTPDIKDCLDRIRAVEDKIHSSFFAQQPEE